MKHFWLLFVLLLHHKNVQSNDLVHRNFKGTELELDNHPCKAENLKVCLELLYLAVFRTQKIAINFLIFRKLHVFPKGFTSIL